MYEFHAHGIGNSGMGSDWLHSYNAAPGPGMACKEAMPLRLLAPTMVEKAWLRTIGEAISQMHSLADPSGCGLRLGSLLDQV